ASGKSEDQCRRSDGASIYFRVLLVGIVRHVHLTLHCRIRSRGMVCDEPQPAELRFAKLRCAPRVCTMSPRRNLVADVVVETPVRSGMRQFESSHSSYFSI